MRTLICILAYLLPLLILLSVTFFAGTIVGSKVASDSYEVMIETKERVYYYCL